MWAYVVALAAAVLCLIIAIILRAGRSPARGGAIE
jgi:hypothetical protein